MTVVECQYVIKVVMPLILTYVAIDWCRVSNVVPPDKHVDGVKQTLAPNPENVEYAANIRPCTRRGQRIGLVPQRVDGTHLAIASKEAH